jgi:hypothetical protein
MNVPLDYTLINSNRFLVTPDFPQYMDFANVIPWDGEGWLRYAVCYSILLGVHFYFVTECGCFTVYKACIRREIPCQLSCSGTR